MTEAMLVKPEEAIHGGTASRKGRLGKGKVLARVPGLRAYVHGDELEVGAKLEIPPVVEDFSCRDYFARRGAHGLNGWPKVRLLSPGRGSPVYYRDKPA